MFLKLVRARLNELGRHCVCCTGWECGCCYCSLIYLYAIPSEPRWELKRRIGYRHMKQKKYSRNPSYKLFFRCWYCDNFRNTVLKAAPPEKVTRDARSSFMWKHGWGHEWTSKNGNITHLPCVGDWYAMLCRVERLVDFKRNGGLWCIVRNKHERERSQREAR